MSSEFTIPIENGYVPEILPFIERNVIKYFEQSDKEDYQKLLNSEIVNILDYYYIKKEGSLIAAMITLDRQIIYLFVDENYQGKGYGTILLNNFKTLGNITLIVSKTKIATDFFYFQGFDLVSSRNTFNTKMIFRLKT